MDFFLGALTALIFIFELIGAFTGVNLRVLIWDQLLHFSGGVWVVLVFLYFFKLRPQIFDAQKNVWLTGIFAWSFVALVGVLWEFFEYAVDFFSGGAWINTAAWGMDTFQDLFLDLSGGLVVVLVFLSRKSRLK